MKENFKIEEFYKINLIQQQELRIKYLLKSNKICFFFCAARTDSISWFDIDETFKINKLNYFKTYTKAIDSIINYSVYKNNTDPFLTRSTTTIVNFYLEEICNSDFILLTPNGFFKQLSKKLELLSFVLNKKFYTIEQIKKIENLTYKKTLYCFFNTIQQTKQIIIHYIRTQNK